MEKIQTIIKYKDKETGNIYTRIQPVDDAYFWQENDALVGEQSKMNFLESKHYSISKEMK